MDLIGNVRNIDTRLGKWKSSQERGKPAKKYPHPEQPKEKKLSEQYQLEEGEAWVGRIIDTKV